MSLFKKLIQSSEKQKNNQPNLKLQYKIMATEQQLIRQSKKHFLFQIWQLFGLLTNPKMVLLIVKIMVTSKLSHYILNFATINWSTATCKPYFF